MLNPIFPGVDEVAMSREIHRTVLCLGPPSDRCRRLPRLWKKRASKFSVKEDQTSETQQTDQPSRAAASRA